MRLRRVLGGTHVWFKSAQVVLGAMVASIGAAAKADDAKVATWWPLARAFQQSFERHDGWVAPLTLLIGILGAVRSVIEPPWVWEAVHATLDDLRDDIFKAGANDPLHHHRATLFQHVRWRFTWSRWPWSGWLIAVERSGHTTQGAITVFKAPDDADQAEGIAGRAWASRAAVPVDNLPDLSGAPTEDDYRIYAERTGVSVAWVKKRRPKSRSLCGIPVLVKGKPWGVLVLDSRSPASMSQENANLYRPISRQLGIYLGRL